MSSAISVVQEVDFRPNERPAEVSPSRFVYRIGMSCTQARGYQDLMIIIGDEGEFVVTAYRIGLAADFASARASESWVMVTADNVERLGYALASAAGGPGRAAVSCFIRRPRATDLERECVEGVISVTAGGGGLQAFARLLLDHGVPFERWER